MAVDAPPHRSDRRPADRKMAQSSQDVKTAPARTSGAPAAECVQRTIRGDETGARGSDRNRGSTGKRSAPNGTRAAFSDLMPRRARSPGRLTASECVQRTIQLRERGVDPRLDLRRALRGPVLRQLAEGSVLHRSHPPLLRSMSQDMAGFQAAAAMASNARPAWHFRSQRPSSPGRPTARGYRPFECKYRAVQAHRRRRPEAPARRLHRRERQRQVVAQHRRHRHRDLHLSADALLALRPAVRRLVAPLLVQSSRRHVPRLQGPREAHRGRRRQAARPRPEHRGRRHPRAPADRTRSPVPTPSCSGGCRAGSAARSARRTTVRPG